MGIAMKTRIEEIWDEIAESNRSRPIEPGAYVLRRTDPAFRFDVFAGVDSSGFVMLAIGVGRPPPAIKLDSVSLDYFRQQRADESWLMALRLRQPALVGVFGRLSQDLVDATATVANEAELVMLVRDRLNLWKKLFDHGSGGQLEPYQVKGLIAELIVLESTLLAGQRPALEVVTAWVGPAGADQDFQFSDQMIEVKAIGPGSEGVSISSLQQLVSALPIRLNVQTMRSASAGEKGAIGLNELVPRIEGRLSTSPDALSLLKGKLLEAGYVEAPYYDTILFQVLATEEFPVTKGFPKLTPDLVPRGVVSATYALSLDSIRNPT
jgi:hypothetical protein